MVISEADRFAFLDIPRTGSSSMHTMLVEDYQATPVGRHQWPAMRRILPADWFIFSIVRNPYDRAVSIWRFCMFRKTEFKRTAGLAYGQGIERFETWVDRLADMRPSAHYGRPMVERIAAAQSAFIEQAGGPLNQILRLETIDRDIRALPFYDPAIAFPRRNVSSGPDGPIVVEARTVEQIADIYAVDFKRLGYSTDPADAHAIRMADQ